MNTRPEEPVLTVVVPVYNEAPTIAAALQELLNTKLSVPMEILVVDDGSQDGSADEISYWVESGAVRLIRHPENRGKGAAVRTAIAEAKGDILTIFDADLECRPEDYRQLVDALLDGRGDVVYGIRPLGAETAISFWHIMGNRLINLWASFLFNTWISDVETCFKMAPVQTWRALNLTSNGFDIEAEATAKFLRTKRRIFQVPIGYNPRQFEEGKKMRWTDGFIALWVLLRVKLLGR